ncbi:YybH family protein [Tropicimonas isoalkanivorans]|uniref:Ketosteroid isomerase homolog n=1 Tax=Tropicimonas isoalkanivorans TaxID=441112 RepID=A0A1I1DMG5_9RHOB|nr:nuclear transport factor 2 family protein [Tropicimonas isoalkanivorans]SFB75562.1 Ketosteroid isomerase homolog [Tropicimonas isoalkanivorans]
MIGPRTKILVIAAVAAGVLGFGSARADDTADRAAIETLWDSYEAASVAGDAEGWLALWDAEGIQMPPGIPARRIDSIAEGLADRWAERPPRTMSIRPIDIEIAGDWAFARGNYDVTTVIDGTDVTMEGKFLTILKRQDDGSFRIYRDCFNANAE